MTTHVVVSPKELLAEHLTELRAYATRVVSNGESLTECEDSDKTARMEEFVTIGRSFALTDRDLVMLLYGFDSGR